MAFMVGEVNVWVYYSREDRTYYCTCFRELGRDRHTFWGENSDPVALLTVGRYSEKKFRHLESIAERYVSEKSPSTDVNEVCRSVADFVTSSL